MVAVNQLWCWRSEDAQVGRQEPVEQVNIFFAPTHYGGVEPIHSLYILPISGHNAIAEVSPVSVLFPFEH